MRATFQIVHHNDQDGWCAAAAIGLKIDEAFRRGLVPSDTIIRFIETDYGKEPPIEKLLPRTPHDRLYLVDFSFKFPIMRDLASAYGKNFVWIDHHMLSPEIIELPIPGIRDEQASACLLAFFWDIVRSAPQPLASQVIGNQEDPEITPVIPPIVQAIDKSDMGRFDIENYSIWRAIEFFDFLRLDGREAKDFVTLRDWLINWAVFFEPQKHKNAHNAIRELYSFGTRIFNWERREAKKLVSDGVVMGVLEGLRVAGINVRRISWPLQMALEAELPTATELYVAYWRDGEDWRYALRRPHWNQRVLCHEIAQKFGGGGHPGAAGFRSKKFLF